MIASLSRVLGVDPGFDAKNVLTMQMSLPQAVIYNGPPDHPLFCRDMDERISAIPGVVQQAQLHMRRQARWRSPYYWAGFSLYGDWSH